MKHSANIFKVLAILTVTALILVALPASPAKANATTGLILHWIFNEGAGTSVADSSGNGLTGTISGTNYSWSTDVPAGTGLTHSIYFSGGYSAGTRVQSAAYAFPRGGAASPRTLCAWAKSKDGSLSVAAEHIANYGWSSTNMGFGIMIYAGSNWHFYAQDANDVNTGIRADTNWHNHCVTYASDGTLKYYIDANLVAFRVEGLFTQGTDPASYMVVGDRVDFPARTDRYFDGWVADVRLYNRALTAAEVTNVYAANPPSVASQTLKESYTGTGPASFSVTFSEDVSVAGGTTDAESATNPDNYWVINLGANGVLDTASCKAGLAGDDTRVTVGSVTYPSNTANTALVTLAAPLPVGSYHLLVCGTTSIVDLVGDQLKGDGTNPGTDFHFNFTVATAAATTTTTATGASSENSKKEKRLPNSGFAPNVVTQLPAQPAASAYSDLGGLWLEIPSQGVKANIVGVPESENAGNIQWLGNNVGWVNGTAFPTWQGNSVLTAHVVNADGLSGPFEKLGQLDYNEQLIVHLYGQSYIYQVRNKRVVRPTDTDFAFEHLEGNSYLTLVTCYGYDPQTNTYRYRRLIRAELVGVKADK